MQVSVSDLSFQYDRDSEAMNIIYKHKRTLASLKGDRKELMKEIIKRKAEGSLMQWLMNLSNNKAQTA